MNFQCSHPIRWRDHHLNRGLTWDGGYPSFFLSAAGLRKNHTMQIHLKERQVDFVPSPSPMTSTTLQRLCICRDARKYWMFLGWGGQRIGMSGVPAHNLPFYKGLTSHQMDPNGACQTGNQAGSDISVSESIKSCYFTLSTSRIRLAFPTNLQACHFISYCTAQLSPPDSG
jgi:hypothetical protein